MDGIKALRIITKDDEQYICDLHTKSVAKLSCFKVLQTSKLVEDGNFITGVGFKTRVWTSVEDRNMYIPAIRVKTIREIKYKLKAYPKL